MSPEGTHVISGPKPLLTLPTSCQGPQEFSLEELGTWQEEDALAHENDPLFKTQTASKLTTTRVKRSGSRVVKSSCTSSRRWKPHRTRTMPILRRG